MKKNVAGQKVGAAMVNATTGAAFTGTVTVYVTLDAGAQAIGTVGSGVCTHEGNGYHTYAPSQAETNGDLLAYTFTGSGAIPATVQRWTNFPQTVDNATNIATILGRVTAAVATNTDMATVLSRLSSARAGYLDNLSAGAVALQGTLSSVSSAVGSLPSAGAVATAVLASVVEGSRTMAQTLRGLWSLGLTKASGFDTGTVVLRDAADGKNRVTIATGPTGRTSVTVGDLD